MDRSTSTYLSAPKSANNTLLRARVGNAEGSAERPPAGGINETGRLCPPCAARGISLRSPCLAQETLHFPHPTTSSKSQGHQLTRLLENTSGDKQGDVGPRNGWDDDGVWGEERG